jgi:hypothetical protein
VNNLTSSDLAMFAKLGIGGGLLALAQVARVTDSEARTDYGIVHSGHCGGIVFPYILHGRRVTCHLRRDFPETDSKGRQKNKYIFPKNDVRHLYLVPGQDAQLTDQTIPAIIVESEKSALAIHAFVLRTGFKLFPVATGGASGWSAKRGHKPKADGGHEANKDLLPELDSFESSRAVGILFDSNVTTNKTVRAGRARLAKRLRGQGAQVRLFDLPPLPGVNGPDDLIQQKGDQAFIDLLNAKPTKATILVDPSGTPVAVDQAEEILLEHSDELRIFQRGGEAVRIVRLPEPVTSGGLTRPAGTVLIAPLDRHALLEAFERLINFEEIGKRGNLKQIHCPGRVADFYLSRADSKKLPVLLGVAFAPFQRTDGSIVSEDGYDEATGLFLLSSEEWLPVADEPTRDDALAALEILKAPFMEFPWCEPADLNLSVHLAAILTAIQRRVLPACPLIGYSAPQQRNGKSLLAESNSLIAAGISAPCQAVSEQHEEFRKVVFASLYEGYLVVNLDNLEKPLSSPHLSVALTQETYADRPLGRSGIVHLPTRMLWTATGNNLTFRGDLAVRTLLARIDARAEKPEERKFQIPDLVEHLKTNRAQLIQAALTILRAYHVADRPAQDIPNWGGFDEWTRAIRYPLTWLGLPDPVGSRKTITDDDVERESAVALLHALRQTFGAQPFLISEAIRRSKIEGEDRSRPFEYLDNALGAVAEHKGQINLRALGWWLRRWKDRHVEKMCLCSAGEEHRAVLWKIHMEGDSE